VSSLASLFCSSQGSAVPAPELYIPFQSFRFNTERLTPLTQVCLYRFRIRYCLPYFIPFPSFTRKHWQVTRELGVTSQGYTRSFRPRRSRPGRSGAPWFPPVTRPGCNYFSAASPLFSSVFLPSVDGVARKVCLLHRGASTTPAGKSFPYVWLNLSYFED